MSEANLHQLQLPQCLVKLTFNESSQLLGHVFLTGLRAH